MKTLAYCVTLLLGIALPSTFLHADSQVGDWGHFLRYQPRVYLNNPDGEAFTVTVHAMQWGTEAWVRDTLPVRITDPSGQVVVEGEHELKESAATFEFPKGEAGVWVVEAEKQSFLTTTLAHAVLGQPEAVQRRGVEQPDAGIETGAHRRPRLLVGERPVHVAKRRPAEAHDRHAETRSAEWAHLVRPHRRPVLSPVRLRR